MGQYRLAFYFEIQIGFYIKLENYMITIGFPFFVITIGLLHGASGFRFFRDN